MADLVPVHGGLAAPVDRTVPADRIDVLRKAVAAMPVLRIDDADLSSLYRFGDGALSPLTGPMNSEQWNRSLDHGVVQRDGKNYAWTIPISFPITKEEATSIKSGVKAQLQNARGEFVGMIAVNDVFPYDKS